MYYALGAGDLFDITAKSEFVETLIGTTSARAPSNMLSFFCLRNRLAGLIQEIAS